MKHRIDIADNTVIAVVQGYFGIHLRSLEFLPVGEGSWAYKGIDASKRQWFIKLSRLNTSAIARITSYLHDEHNLTFVLSPIATKSKDAASELVMRARNYDVDDSLLRGLRDFMKSRRSAIDQTLINGRLLSEFCKQHSYEFVVCHADIHPFNIMKTTDGLVMIDWEGVMLAPRERDLMFYGKDILSADSDFHRAYGLDYQADEYLISYYNYEWVLQEYTDYMERLFDLSLAEQAREHALEEFMGLFGSGKELGVGGVVKGALDSPLP